MMNSLVDKVYVITTLDSSRTCYVTEHLNNRGIKYEFVVSPKIDILSNDVKLESTENSDGRCPLSLLSSFTSILKSSVLNELDSICILEDDCYFSPNWESGFRVFYDNIPRGGWDIINAGYHGLNDSDSVYEEVNEFVRRPMKWHHGSHCMLLKLSVFEPYVDVVRDTAFQLPADVVFNRLYADKQYNCYYPRDKFIYQMSQRTDQLNDRRYDLPVPFIFDSLMKM
jgi:hypothetical protein